MKRPRAHNTTYPSCEQLVHRSARLSNHPYDRLKTRFLSTLDAFPAHLIAHRPRDTSYRSARSLCNTENTAGLDLRGQISTPPPMRYGTHSRGAQGRARIGAAAHHGRLWACFLALSASTARRASNAPSAEVLRPPGPLPSAAAYRPLQHMR